MANPLPVIVAFSLVVLQLAGLAYAACDKGYSYDSGVKSPALDAKWMNQLFDHTPLSQLSLPGTHDTMAYQSSSPLFTTLSKCQSSNLADQLRSGIRLLDIRCKRVNNAFAIYHGPVSLSSTFTDVLNAANTFLTANPTETILMRIKEEDTAVSSSLSFEGVFLTYYNNNRNLFWTYTYGNNNPSLKDIRGKIVVLQNWAPDVANQYYGIPYTGSVISIQDNYAMSSKCDLSVKWNSITSKLSETTSGSWSQLYMQYLSASGGSMDPYFYASGKSSPGTCDPSLQCGCTTASRCISEFWTSKSKKYFKGTNELLHDWSGWSMEPRRVGLVYADFPDGNLISRIYNQNSIILDQTSYDIRPSYITNLAKCLHLTSASAGVKLQSYDCSTTAATYQKFTFYRKTDTAGQQYVEIRTAGGLCLEVEGSFTYNGAAIQTATCTNGLNQRFVPEPRDGGFRLKAMHSGKCIDVDQWLTTNGAAIHTWDCVEQGNEFFKLRK